MVIAFIITAAALMLPEEEAAWNSGSRERLADALRGIVDEVMAGEVQPVTAWQGVAVKWYRQGTYENAFFYPVAVVPEVTLTPAAELAAAPLVVMVPVGSAEAQHLPTLSAGEPDTLAERQERQREQIKECFAAHGVGDAALLLSDGSVEHRPVDGLW